jgi:hypothetical protein
MSEHRSRFWLWFCIAIIVLQSIRCDYHKFNQMQDLQRRVGQIESERR